MTPANDNAPTKLAEQLKAFLEFRNRPDSPPDPLQSSWSVAPSTAIVETEVEGDGEVVEKFAEDLLLEITPSIRQIAQQIAEGPVVYGEPELDDEGKPLTSRGPILEIGKLNFSDGEKHERAYKRGIDGEVVAYMRKMPLGAMLGTAEKLGGVHGSGSPSVVTISNSNLTHRLQPASGEKIVARPYIPAIRKRRTGHAVTIEHSRELLAQAYANTPVMPEVKVCPPGIASGTARYSDQFIGMKVGSTGKGGAPNWVDFFMAGRDHEEWVEAMATLDEETRDVLDRALTASNLAQLGKSGHKRTMERQAKRRLVAANDNLAAATKKSA